MSDRSLTGKRIAVLVESQYITSEIATYQERFGSYGAEVDLVSRLWGQPKQTFVSEVEVAGRTPDTLEVRIDLEGVDSADYAAVIMAANYTSVRLRWNEAAATSDSPAESVREAPAVRFFGHAMQDHDVVKGAPCHGLWLLTPMPELLAGRRVTCNPVILADVLSAGATYVPAPTGSNWHTHVVTDDDLVTSMSAVDGGCEAFVDAVTEAIMRPRAAAMRPSAAAQVAARKDTF